MEELFVTAVVLFATYNIIKLLSDHLLRRKIIKAGHIEQAGILERPKEADAGEEINKYPSLKWGLVAFFAGLGLIIIEIIRMFRPEIFNYHQAVLPIGIELVFISLGFLIYFYIMNLRNKK